MFEFDDADGAREAVRAGIEYLMVEDGYTATQIRDDLVQPTLDSCDADSVDVADTELAE